MVRARHVSMMALLSFSLTLSSSISRKVPRKIYRQHGRSSSVGQDDAEVLNCGQFIIHKP
jgi:hypothetical protein